MTEMKMNEMDSIDEMDVEEIVLKRNRFMRCLRVLFIIAVMMSGALSARATGERIRLTPAMLTNESKSGKPELLFDEQDATSAPLAVKPKTCWGQGARTADYPLACTLDLQRERNLGTIWLFDKNSSGHIRIQAGQPGAWRDVIGDDLAAYDQWKEFRIDVRTRYLHLIKEVPGANVAEIALFEKSRPDPSITTPTLIDEIRCGAPADAHPFQQFPDKISQVQTILGRPCRTLPNAAGEMKYFAYRIGTGKGLKAGGAYLLEVDYPEDAPRTVFIQNRGCEESLGFHTGPTVGDVLKGRYTFSNAESLNLPLAGEYRTWKTLFFLHDRFPGLVQPRGEGAREMTPADGFWVVVAQPKAGSDPLSQGAAVSAIRLYEVSASYYDIKRPQLPAGLPSRHLFCREEMGDGAVADSDPSRRGLVNISDWYEFKARRMRHLAMDTFCKDLLEFGTNQGWDPSPHGGNSWYWGSDRNTLWPNILTLAHEYGLNVLPYYEYAGSVGSHGLGSQRDCQTLGGGKTYTHIRWSEKAHADVTDPRFLTDAKNLLDATIYRYKDRANIIGAWFRQRPSAMPISFSDRCLARFFKEETVRPDFIYHGKDIITAEDLKKNKELYEYYRKWWYDKRHMFFLDLSHEMAQMTGHPGAFLMFTTDTTEPGVSYPDWKRPLVVAEDVTPWARLGIPAISLSQTIKEERHLAALTRDPLTWSWYEWQHAAPPADPEHYKHDDFLMLTYTFNRAYTVGSPAMLEAFRTKKGLALVRHYSLNENEMDVKVNGKDVSPLGYFVADVEAAGPYCMLAEARAMANGDPFEIGYLSGRQYNRGFFEYVRDFNLNFLALPALPGKLLPGATSDPEVVVRKIDAGAKGLWLAVVNTGVTEKKNVKIKLPAMGPEGWRDAVSGEVLPAQTESITLTLRPCQLRALCLK